jgi:hypothetical protein
MVAEITKTGQRFCHEDVASGIRDVSLLFTPDHARSRNELEFVRGKVRVGGSSLDSSTNLDMSSFPHARAFS